MLLVGSYIPKPSAVGGCAEKIAKELAKNKSYSVTVMSVRNGRDQKTRESKDAYDIIRLSYGYFDIINDDSTSKLYRLYKRVARSARILLSLYSIDKQLSDLYSKGLESLNEEVDVIIPFSFPIETLNSSLSYKRKNGSVLVIPFIYDSYKNSQTLHKFNWNKKIKSSFVNEKELEYFEHFDKFMVIHSFQEFYSSVLPLYLFNKIIFTEHPLLCDQFEDATSENGVVVSYTGALLRGYVEADDILEIIRRAPKKNKFNFYTFGNAASKLEYLATKNNNINSYQKISKNEVVEVINASDVLINISEYNGVQISSKIFEYMSAGKPIIQYSYKKECINSRILSNYPLALLLDRSSGLESNCKSVNTFLEGNSKKRISFHNVSELYSIATPEYNVKILNEIINNK